MRLGLMLCLLAGIGTASDAAIAQAIDQNDTQAVLEEAKDVDTDRLCGPHLHDLAVEPVACVRVTVDLEGRGTNCTIAISSGDPDLDQKTCASAEEHGRWLPARDQLGQPVMQDDYLWIKLGPDGRPAPGDPWPDIRYTYPSRAERLGEEGSVGIRVSIGTDGRVRKCVVILSSGSTILDAASCDQTTRNGLFQIAYDQDGEPTEATYTKLLSWRL